MSIQYTYEVVRVDEAARCMEVVYTSEGRQIQHIGVRLPYVGESLEAVIQAFSPVVYWMEQDTQVQAVATGTTGTLNKPALVTLETTKTNKLVELAAARYQNEASGVTAYGVVLDTDKASQSALASAFLFLQNNVVTSVDWKARNGEWVQLGATEMQVVIQAVATHVQNSFSIEKQLVDLVRTASTIESVEAITWPQ
jgi:hypothetical protein